MNAQKRKPKTKSAKLMVMRPEFRSKVARDKTKYNRKKKEAE